MKSEQVLEQSLPKKKKNEVQLGHLEEEQAGAIHWHLSPMDTGDTWIMPLFRFSRSPEEACNIQLITSGGSLKARWRRGIHGEAESLKCIRVVLHDRLRLMIDRKLLLVRP